MSRNPLIQDHNNTDGLHTIIEIKEGMLVELCFWNINQVDGLVNGMDGIILKMMKFQNK